MSLPDTIKHPETFLKSPAACFDGVFDWSWTQGCFVTGNIKPMDFDGVVERKGNFLIFETKGIGVPIPTGQMFTYESAYRLGVFTIVFIEGKARPEKAKVWCQQGFKCSVKMLEHKETDAARMKSFVSDWYKFADANKAERVDITFLNKKITMLDETFEYLKTDIESIVSRLGGAVKWNSK